MSGIGSSKRNLVVGFLNGRSPGNYSAKDYEQLQLAIGQANNESLRSQRKINKLELGNRLAVEQQLDTMHQRIWLKEWERLYSFRARFQRDLDEVLQLIALSRDTDRPLFIELVEQQEQLDEDVLEFQQSTLAPIEEFCSDVQYWLQNRLRDATLGQDPNLIKETLHSIKSQQTALLDAMEDEQKQLESVLLIRGGFSGGDFDEVEQDDFLTINSGRTTATDDMAVPSHLTIPSDIVDFECDDDDLKYELLQEFATIDSTFFEHVNMLHDQIRQLRFRVAEFEDISRAGTPQLLQFVVEDGDAADKVDPWKVLIVESFYQRAPQDLPKSWYLLYIHFLHLMYPHLKRWQLSQGASLIHQYSVLKRRAKIVTADWHRAHSELVEKVRDTLGQIAEKQKEAHQRAADCVEQRKLCHRLTRQVNEWRRLKMEEARLQQEINSAKMLVDAERLAAVAEKEREETKLRKEKIAKFKESKAEKKRQDIQKAEERLAEVKRQLAEQSELDWERIRYRKGLMDDRRKAAEEKMAEVAEEDAKKEERLETLRRQVRIEAPSNLARTMGNTEAWRNHDERYLKAMQADVDDGAAGSAGDWWTDAKPLFNAPGFSSKQIMSDKRIQLEQKLRETGLIASEYGRALVGRMKPPTVARRDQLGSLGVGDLMPAQPTGLNRPQQDPYMFQPRQ